MTTVFKGGTVVNVQTGELEKKDVLLEGETIREVGTSLTGDREVNVAGKVLCPGFIDGHIHIESSMLLPSEFARVAVLHGTTAVVADPHEIANVCGKEGISFMMNQAENLPMDIFIALPSCVPASPFDESGAVLKAEDLEPFYADERVVSLGEVMDFPGVISGREDLMEKITRAKANGRVINGHAPMVTGADLDAYVAAGITDDHECSSLEEGRERIEKGQWVMIRQGTSARNLKALIGLFEEPFCRHCMLVTDDKHPADLLKVGHLDATIREAVSLGKSAITGIRMATIQAAEYYGLKQRGAIAPGYRADFLVLDDLNTVDVRDVYFRGECVVKDHVLQKSPTAVPGLAERVSHSFRIKELTKDDFMFRPTHERFHIIGVIPGELVTEDLLRDVDWKKDNGIDVEKDILKLAVCERHHNTGHIGLGFIHGIGIRKGAIASSVSHDSHNLIIMGANEEDMAAAGNACKAMGGGLVVVRDGEVLASLPLPIAGLLSEEDAETVARQNEEVRRAVHALGAPDTIEPFMLTAFVSLTVIPHLKMTTHGPVDVDRQIFV